MTMTITRQDAWRALRWKIVRSRLVECMRVDLATAGRVGPKMFGNAMPEYVLDEPRNSRTKYRPTSLEHSLADQCRPWPAQYVPDQEERWWLLEYCLCKVTNRSFAGQCKASGASRDTVNDLIERACKRIVAGLDRDGVVIE